MPKYWVNNLLMLWGDILFLPYYAYLWLWDATEFGHVYKKFHSKFLIERSKATQFSKSRVEISRCVYLDTRALFPRKCVIVGLPSDTHVYYSSSADSVWTKISALSTSNYRGNSARVKGTLTPPSSKVTEVRAETNSPQTSQTKSILSTNVELTFVCWDSG